MGKLPMGKLSQMRQLAAAFGLEHPPAPASWWTRPERSKLAIIPSPGVDLGLCIAVSEMGQDLISS
jgi:hypothetical protein